MYPGRPILVADRFPALRAQLAGLLGGLSPEDWECPTAAPGWCVKDVAAHLLGGDISILAERRDGYHPPQKIREYRELVALVDRLNGEWVLAARRMSPRLLQELLEFTGPELEACFAAMDPMNMGGPVSWAGPEPAPAWFDIAREFTERWHHQQQIRDATGRPPLYSPYFLAPVLDTFVRALPHNYRHVVRPPGTVVRFEIGGEAGGVWFLHREAERWMIGFESSVSPAAKVLLSQDHAWRLFTKGMKGDQARGYAVIEGDNHLVSPIFSTVAIIG